MNRWPIVWSLSLVCGLSPTAAPAHRHPQHQRPEGKPVVTAPVVGRPVHPPVAPHIVVTPHTPLVPHASVIPHSPLDHRVARRFIHTPPVIVYSTSVVAVPVVTQAPPTVVYVATPSVAATAPIPSTPTVIPYPHGRYELRGDGISTPYLWVWIPNPPPPPAEPPEPVAVPPAAPPKFVPPAEDPPATTQPRLSRGELYRWVDEQGVANWTDRLDNVPVRYRAQTQSSIRAVDLRL